MITRTRKISILDVDVDANVKEREVAPGCEMWLDNTLAGHLYPNLKMALVSVPTEILELHEQAEVSESLYKIQFNGTTYRMIGSGGGAKNGKFYFADAEHAPMLHKRFQNWPEALIAYFGIQTSDCKRIHDFVGTVLIVPDNVLGTNDCRGWLRASWARILRIPEGHFCQFRAGFAFENGKGSFKEMPDDVADAVGADIILPESSCKPAPLGLKPWSYKSRAERFFIGQVVVGIREISRELVFGSSYTVAQHASREVVETEFIPKAREAMQALKDAWESGNHEAVVQQIGKKITLDEFGQDVEESEEELRTVEAALIADGSGEIMHHPYIYRQVDKLLAKWAFRVRTGGGLHLPGYALADDGYLFLRPNGEVVSGSDWLPLDMSINHLMSDRSLCVRYPVRMKEDLLPMLNCDREEAIQLLVMDGLAEGEVAFVAEKQLLLTGTYTLNSKKAKENGGDFDFDQICVVDEDLYPKFVADRFSFKSTFSAQKNKVDRLKSPIYSLEFVAMKSLGNKIGVITNLMSSCVAAANMDSMYRLVHELQKEIDSLKHNIRADHEVIKEIKGTVPMAPWLAYKEVKTLTAMKMIEDADLLPNDNIGYMYNALGTDLMTMLGKPYQLRQFQGLIVGNTPTKEMLEECRTVYQSFSAGHAMLRKNMKRKTDLVASLDAQFKAAKQDGKQEQVRKLRKELSKAAADVRLAEKKQKEQSAFLINMVALWGKGKTENIKAWTQAMHTVVSMGSGSGSIVFHTFPQEVVDAIAERTGGIRSKVALKEAHGTVIVENNVFYTQTRQGRRVAKFEYDPEKRLLKFPKGAAA
jgi:hypothetical protein